MKKRLFTLFCLMLGVLLTVGLASCGKDVEFNVNFIVDGETYATIGTSGEETIKIPENPTKEGYTFDGWYWDDGVWQKPFTANSLLDTPLSSDMSVYAKWAEIQIDAPAPLQGTDIKSQQLTVNGDQISASLSNTTETFSFLNDLTVAKGANYVVASDIGCEQTIASKTVSLQIGDNTYYVLVTNGNAQKLYTVTVRRRPMYGVSFTTNGGTSVSSQTVEEGSLATEPTTTRAGYAFTGWDHDFTTPIMGNTRITASWTANTDTPYKVEYYLQNIDDDGYTRLDSETKNLTGTTGTRVTAEQKTFEHFTLSTYMSTLSGNVNGNGSLVLKVHYTRNKYTLSNANTSYGSITNAGSYKYGSASIISTATAYLGYEFLGWYSGNERVSIDATYTFTFEKNVEARFGVKAEMANFNFTSTATTCTITGLKDKTITEIVVPNYVTSIGGGSFRGCNTLESITLPFVGSTSGAADYTSHFGYVFGYISSPFPPSEYHFYYDGEHYTYSIPTSLKTVVITGGAFIGSSAFRYCRGLTNITIPSSVSSIGYEAFYCCSGLTSITIPSIVTRIGSSAFYGCHGLTSVTIPSSVTSIGDDAFYGCNNLTSVYITNLTAWCKISFRYPSSNPLYYAKNLYLNGNKLAGDIIIPEGVTTIPAYTFCNCDGLTSITIPNSVTSIGSGAFRYCSGLTAVYITDLAAWCNISFNDSYSNPLHYTNLYLNGNKVTALEIPEGVTSIGSYAFLNCSGLTSITIPNSVTSIGSSAFWGCSGIIQKENGVSYVDKWVIDCDTSVTSVTLRANTVGIGEDAFWYCSGLTSITIPSSVTSIGSYAFEDCSGLTSITIPNSVTSIGDYAFYYCSGLTSINYRGTEAQWNAITKGSSWNYNTGDYTITYNYTGE